MLHEHLPQSKKAISVPNHQSSPVWHLQPTINSDIELQKSFTDNEERQEGLTGTASLHCGHNFGRIPLFTPAAGVLQTKLATNKRGDKYGPEEDRVSDLVMRIPELQLQRKCACGGATARSGECEECSKKTRFNLQNKLKVNEPGDFFEKEADRIADQVMAKPVTSAVSGVPFRIQRLTGRSYGGQTDAAPGCVEQALASPGRPLEPALRQDMEQRFGHDFSRVRVHSGAAAEQSAQDLNAHAYTVGHKIVFGAGLFAPGTNKGRHLLAHELTHVVQQSGSEGIHAGKSNKNRGLSTDYSAALPKDVLTGAIDVPLFSTGLLIARKSRTGVTTAGGKAVMKMDREEARLVLAEYIYTSGVDETLAAMNAIEAALRMPYTLKNSRLRLRMLTAAFSLLDDGAAASVLRTLTEPVGPKQKSLRERFNRLISENRQLLLEILQKRIAAKSLQEADQKDEQSEVPSVEGNATWVELHEDVFAYLPDIETTVERVAAYVSGHPKMPDALAKLNGVSRRALIPKTKPIIIPIEFIDRPRAIREMPADIRSRVASRLADLAQQERNKRYGKVEMRGKTIGLAPITTEPIKEVVSSLRHLGAKVAYVVAFIAGVLHGFLSSLWSMLKGVAELAYGILKSIFTLSVLSDLRELGKAISNLSWDSIKEALGEWAAKWEAKLNSNNPFVAGHAHGYLTGYVMAEAAMLLLSFGTSAVLKGTLWATRLGQVVRESSAFRTLAAGIRKATQASEKTRAVLTNAGASLTRTKAVQALAVARQAIGKTLRLPIEVVSNLTAEAIGRLAQLSQPLLTRIRDLSNRAKIWLLGCRSACRVDILFMKNQLKRMTNKEIDDFVAKLDEVAETPKVKGGKIEDRRVPTGKVRRMEAEDIPRLTKTETLAQAIARIRTVIGKTIADDPALRKLWDEAAYEVMRGKRLTKGNAVKMYERTRNKFWQKVRRNPHRFRDAGFAFPRSETRAPYLRGMRKNIRNEEITISLDHNAEKAIASNWKRALDPTNLVYEFAAPNSWREITQMRHPGLRP